jgi:tripartite-type tricarboxylate transporter receptor subunit TctC
MQDVVAGQLDMIISDPVATLQEARAGNIKAYAVCANRRRPSAPEFWTVDEAGFARYHFALWHGLWMPRGPPKPILDKVHAAVVERARRSGGAVQAGSIGAGHLSRERQTPKALAAQQKSEIEKWWPIIKAGNIKVE